MIGFNNPPSQIFTSSRCLEFENDLKDQLRKLIGNKNIHLSLADAVCDDYRSYGLTITDNVIRDYDYEPLWPEFWGSFSYDPVYENRKPVRLFHCLINRTDPIRQSWFYQLVRRNLIDLGAVSFNLKWRSSPPPGVDINDKPQLYQWIFEQGCEIFAAEHELMKDRVPFENFSGDLDQVICDSKVGVVIETYFDRNEITALSEKVFRALQLPRPFFLYCAPGSVGILRDLGFDVYDDVIDHSYDNIADGIARQIKILNQIKPCDRLTYTNEVLENYESRAQHNRDLLKQLKRNWPSRLEKVIATIQNYK